MLIERFQHHNSRSLCQQFCLIREAPMGCFLAFISLNIVDMS